MGFGAAESRGGQLCLTGCMAAPRNFVSSVLPPRQRGEEFGRSHTREIARTVAAYSTLFDTYAGAPFDLEYWGLRAWETISALAPTAADEIAGIADGAGIAVSRLAAINARTELLAIASPDGIDECSTVVALPPEGPPVAAQTWDWYDDMRDNWLVWTIPFPDGRRIQTMTEYGVLAKVGVNDAGLGVMLNLLRHVADDQLSLGTQARVGFPIHLLLRTLLEEARTVAEARALIGARSYSASSALTVADRGGDAVSFEVFPTGLGEVAPTDGLLVRTNHFVSEVGAPGCRGARRDRNSWVRRDALLAALSAETASAQTVVAAMCHHDPEGSVCLHPDPTSLLEPTATLATCQVDPVNARLDVSPGGPCR